ncbi:variable large family protein [Borrelia coriaceae]|uniref:Variable large protein n=1 Tax=Borrelia coriaceae ATCC 43381 TaxID=1408429 RepID=W5SX77_9SPIR|nr:variable large family protein [Borrelia coriaceae]AHH11789.1 Variable major protein [Borrelia coriaceae ATCC 43381]
MKINIKNIKVKSICATLFISLFLSCNSGVIEELEKKKTFADSLVKIGHGFQEIFGSFGNAFGFTAVKSTDNRSIVGDYFEKIKKGLADTKGKLDALAKDISSVPHADTTEVKAVISSSIEVIIKMIDSVTKIAGVTKENTSIDVNHSSKPAGANPDSVKTVIAGVKDIIETAKGSGVQIEPGSDNGTPVTNDDGAKAPAALVGKNSIQAGANAGHALADEVAKADPWAMINKIKDSTKTGTALTSNTDNDAGQLATGTDSGTTAGAKSTADLASAAALKAMTNKGQFSANSANEEVKVIKGAAASAVNKVLGVLDLIIRKTVVKNLEKLREAVEKIQYSETTGEVTEGKN